MKLFGIRRKISLILTLIMVFSLFATPAYANEPEGMGEAAVVTQITKEIISFAGLSAEVKNQTYTIGMEESALVLPETLEASAWIETDGVREDFDSVEVLAWEPDKTYDSETSGVYLFLPSLDSSWNVTMELPVIEVILEEVLQEEAVEENATTDPVEGSIAIDPVEDANLEQPLVEMAPFGAGGVEYEANIASGSIIVTVTGSNTANVTGGGLGNVPMDLIKDTLIIRGALLALGKRL